VHQESFVLTSHERKRHSRAGVSEGFCEKEGESRGVRWEKRLRLDLIVLVTRPCSWKGPISDSKHRSNEKE